MANIFFFSIPAHGHINPTLGVVKELIARGHDVRYYSYHAFREKIEATGAIFVSCDDCVMEKKLTPDEVARLGSDLALSTKVLVETTLALDDKIKADILEYKPDCIVADSMAPWGRAAAMKYQIPFVSSVTTFAFNQHSAKIMKQSVFDLIRLVIAMPKINNQLKRLQKKGYHFKSVLELIQNDDQYHSIVFTSRKFQPCAETFSQKVAFVGPSVRAASTQIEVTKHPLIYISMGTVNNHMVSFYRSCIEAFRKTDYQVILSVGEHIDRKELGELPDNIITYSSVDQIAILQQADVFLSHCGMNSVSESLYFGVPLVMMPQTPEQKGVAERVRQCGAGLLLEKTDPISLLNAVNKLLADEKYKEQAVAMGKDFQNCPGAKGAADKIMQVIEEAASLM